MEKPSEGGNAPYLAAAVFALLILYGAYINLRHDYYWNKGTRETCATVSGLASSDAYGNEVLHFYYYADSVKYSGSATASYFPCEDTNKCSGYSFKITYAVQNPDVADFNLENACN